EAEATAVLDVPVGQVERHQIELAAIDDHELGVITGQVVGGARHAHAGGQQTHLETPQTLLARAIGVRDQGVDGDAAADRVGQRVLDLTPVEAEDDDLDTAPGGRDPADQRQDAVARLYE